MVNTKNHKTKTSLPDEGFVRINSILNVVPVGRSTWWAGVKSGKYPQPVRTLGARITVWRVEEIRALIERAGQEERP